MNSMLCYFSGFFLGIIIGFLIFSISINIFSYKILKEMEVELPKSSVINPILTFKYMDFLIYVLIKVKLSFKIDLNWKELWEEYEKLIDSNK